VTHYNCATTGAETESAASTVIETATSTWIDRAITVSTVIGKLQLAHG
jgi:hypothetical protein